VLGEMMFTEAGATSGGMLESETYETGAGTGSNGAKEILGAEPFARGGDVLSDGEEWRSVRLAVVRGVRGTGVGIRRLAGATAGLACVRSEAGGVGAAFGEDEASEDGAAEGAATEGGATEPGASSSQPDSMSQLESTSSFAPDAGAA
jgi:hypothetical protein